jgi:Putative peptidoglycan binding domain
MGRLIQLGCKGADVRAVQDVLNFHIRRLQPLDVDSAFGPLTQARVVEFQRVNRLQVDGIVGPETLGKLFEEELLPVSLALVPQLELTMPPLGRSQLGLQAPRLIPPLTLPPLTPPPPPVLVPFLLPPNSTAFVPTLNQRGQALNLSLTTPVRSDPVDPTAASSNQIIQLLSFLPPDFPFRAFLIDQVPKPVTKVGPLELDPVAPMSFGFKWGVNPLFDLKSVGPPVEFTVGANANARYSFMLIDRPGAGVPQMAVTVGGDFTFKMDWTSEKAQSRPLVDVQGSVLVGLEGRF